MRDLYNCSNYTDIASRLSAVYCRTFDCTAATHNQIITRFLWFSGHNFLGNFKVRKRDTSA